LLPNPGVSPQTHLPSLSLPSLFGRRKGRKVIGSEGNDKDNKFKVLQSVPCFHFSCLSFIGNKFIILVTYGPFSSRNHSQFVPHPRNHFQASSLPHVARLLSAGGGGHTGRGEEVWRVEEEWRNGERQWDRCEVRRVHILQSVLPQPDPHGLIFTGRPRLACVLKVLNWTSTNWHQQRFACAFQNQCLLNQQLNKA
jgi:hypothetical protein